MIINNIHPVNEFSEEYILEFSKKVIAAIAVGIDVLSGEALEMFQAKIFGVKWHRSDKIIDVQVRKTGFSLKSLQFAFPVVAKNGKNKSIRTTIGRCFPDLCDKYINKNTTPAAEAGEIITTIWNDRLKKEQDTCEDCRTLIILKSKNLLQWLLFEFVLKSYDSSEFNWAWVTRKNKGRNTTNLQGVKDDITLSWQPSGSHFNLSHPIPNEYTQFKLIKPKKIIPEEDILEQIGFEKAWILK